MNIMKISCNDINFGNRKVDMTKKIRVPYDKTRKMINEKMMKEIEYVRDLCVGKLVSEDIIENIYNKYLRLAESLHITL